MEKLTGNIRVRVNLENWYTPRKTICPCITTDRQ